MASRRDSGAPRRRVLSVVARGGALVGTDTTAVALPVSAGDETSAQTLSLALDDRLAADAQALVARGTAKAGAGELLAVPVVAGAVRTLLLYGTGDSSARAFRMAGAALARKARDEPAMSVVLPPGAGPDALAEGLVLGSYRYRAAGAAPKAPALEQVDLVGEQADIAPALVRARAVLLARDLANTPSLIKSPQWLAEQAMEAGVAGGLDVRIRDEHELAAEGFAGILGVGAGSVRPPRLIEMRYAPRGSQRHVVLVGKGITFDSGGLSLKPNDGMVAMKTDMAAGAAVIAVMGALRELGVRTRVTGLVAAAENMPSGTAQRPGDVLRHYGGLTSEVLNTDAEGRLVLADALAYAVRRLRPDAVVDLATLTGAASVGLGRRHAALYATDEVLAAALEQASAESGERVWRMPLVEDYRQALESRVADLAHIGTVKGLSGGSIVAALYLREFTGDVPWAHLDIAGPARAESDEDEVSKGATGFGVRLLLRWLEGTA